MKKPETFHTVKQPEGSSICGACLVAMITGLELDTVQAGMTSTTRDGHLYYKEVEIIRFLAAHGIYVGMRAIPLENPLNKNTPIQFDWAFKGNPAILSVKSKVFDDGDHFVFWDGQHVRDSSWANEADTSRLEEYHILEIAPLLYTEEWFMPPSGKLHGEDCHCTTCLTLQKVQARHD